jgi:hypothetical protein
MLATSMLLYERYSLGWPHIHHAIALNPELFMDPLDAADGATGLEEYWLAVYDKPLSASVGRFADLPIPHATQRVFLVSLSEAIRRVRQRASLALCCPSRANGAVPSRPTWLRPKGSGRTKHSLGRRRPNIQTRPAGFTHKGLRSYAWDGFGDVRAPRSPD